ncbi:MAG: hypothetical protein ACP5G2_06420 [Candidatus Bipolaricaulaceae bacterium]
MDLDLKGLISADPRRRRVLSVVAASPYLERQALQQKVGIPADELDEVLATLTEKMVLLELASQADSSVESRVPKKVYLINPDLAASLADLLT